MSITKDEGLDLLVKADELAQARVDARMAEQRLSRARIDFEAFVSKLEERRPEGKP